VLQIFLSLVLFLHRPDRLGDKFKKKLKGTNNMAKIARTKVKPNTEPDVRYTPSGRGVIGCTGKPPGFKVVRGDVSANIPHFLTKQRSDQA